MSCKNILLLSFIFVFVAKLSAFAALSKEGKPRKTELEIPNLGKIYLQKNSGNEIDTTELILNKLGNTKVIVDSYEGLEPYELIKSDFDEDGLPEIVVILSYPEGKNLMPYVYSLKGSLEKIFPKGKKEADILACHRVFLALQNSKPVLALQHLVGFHDYAPPELYRLEMYTLSGEEFKLSQIGYNEGTHYNLLMNRAAEFMHNGNPLEAVKCYREAVASSTGDINSKALAEALFFQAEATKFSRKYPEAMALYEKIVLEYTDCDFTETAQKELEFLYANHTNVRLLDQYITIQYEIMKEQSEKALKQIELLIKSEPDSPIMDRLLFTKAELLIAEDNIDGAMEIYTLIKTSYPESPLIEQIDIMLEDLEAKPEDVDGL